MASPRFVPGRELSTAFYAEVIAPLLGARSHAAALLGPGSDVLGYDTPTSTDHGWGPRLHVFVAEPDVPDVRALVAGGLPERFRGWPVRFGSDKVPVQAHVRVDTLDGWLAGHLGLDPRRGMSDADWLTIPQQILLEVTAGAVHADPDGELRDVRELLTWFPPQVHRWLLMCQWARVGEEEAFVGRAAQVGDELGSRLVAGRLARELMRVAFLLERRYWPYTKWFGSAFARLTIAAELGPALERAVAATDFRAREDALAVAYGVVARAHDASGVTAPVDASVRPYFDRPFLVLGADRFVAACRATITDRWLAALPPIGSVDQAVDSTAILGATGRPHRFRALYAP